MSFALHHQIGMRTHPGPLTRSQLAQAHTMTQQQQKGSRAAGPIAVSLKHLNVPVYYPGGTAAAYAGSRSFSIVQHSRAIAANASPPSVSRIKFGDDHEEDSDEVDAKRVEMMLSTTLDVEEDLDRDELGHSNSKRTRVSQALRVLSIRVPDVNMNMDKSPARHAGEWIVRQIRLPPCERAYTYWIGAYLTVLIAFNAIFISMVRVLGVITTKLASSSSGGEGAAGFVEGEGFKWVHHGLLTVAIIWMRCISVL